MLIWEMTASTIPRTNMSDNRIAENGLLRHEETKLKEIISKNRSVFKIRLGGGGPGTVKPMRIVLEPSKEQLKLEVRNYPLEQEKFMDVYFKKLVDMGFLKIDSQAA